MKPYLEFRKSLLLLDRGQAEKGRETLEQVIPHAEAEQDTVTLVQSLVCLGDLLVELDALDEARSLLGRALAYADDPDLEESDDVLGYEFARATELLEAIQQHRFQATSHDQPLEHRTGK